MFLGEYEYKIDDKGRVPIPPKFRRDLKDGLVLAPGPEACIVAYGLAEWTKMSESLPAGSLAPSKVRRLSRATFATAFSLTLDGQGRVALPITLREYARIGDELVVVGVNTYLEMWNRELWVAEKAAAQEQAWQIIEGLERR
ncbi:MAG TPA: division/cell wall cluster transcriptional repressor MraZ [Dehalococcoidia bacterium]|nr:division/cell wall cluster transcriptional repressor MraZ [Dehalococcoidia bacterium]